MSTDPVEDLPLAHRLALAYAPAGARAATLTLLALDDRLAAILRQRTEAILAQIKLAWWRDRLNEDAADWPLGEPLLARLTDWPGDKRRLVALVDGWEALMAEHLDHSSMEEFARGRSAAWSALSSALGASSAAPEAERAACEWAMADLVMNLGEGDERERALGLARSLSWRTARLPRALRPLAVLHGLARRALARGGSELLDGPGASLAALRIGVYGR